MEASILTSVKKNLGIDEEYTAFDPDILMHINTVFGTLHQLAIGPEDALYIETEDAKNVKWDALLGGAKNLNGVKTYVFLRVKMLFDPPPTSFAITAMEKQIEALEWRLNVEAEGQRING